MESPREVVWKIFLHNRKVVCPFCFEKISVRRAVFRCANKRCMPGIDPVLKRVWGSNETMSSTFSYDRTTAGGLWAWMKKGTDVVCPACSAPSTERLCPECHKELPHSYGTERPVMLSIVGAKSAGKSHYVTVLIDELKKRVGDNFKFALSSLSEDTSIRYRDQLYRPLYDNHTVVDETKSAKDNWSNAEPLVYRLQFFGSQERAKAAVTLSFFDAPGEDLKADDIVSRLSKYVYNSDGLVLLVDSNKLHEAQTRNYAQGLGQASELLERIVRVYERGRQITSSSTLPSYIAIALSKVDLLKPHFPADSALWQNPVHRGSYDYQDFSEVSSLVERKLRDMQAAQLCNFARSRFGEDIGFFGVSALGHAPHGRDGRTVGDIKPLRVAEPILWLLAQHDIVPSSKSLSL